MPGVCRVTRSYTGATSGSASSSVINRACPAVSTFANAAACSRGRSISAAIEAMP